MAQCCVPSGREAEIRSIGRARQVRRRMRKGNNSAMDLFEPVRRGYHAIGLGADEDVRGMLDQSGPEPACWEVRTLGFWRHSHPAGEVAALALFGRLPARFELVRVRIGTWLPDERARLVVGGSFRVRARDTREDLDLPFSHIWSFADGRVREVRNVIEGFDLRRLASTASCAA
jgi:ketosteroid isomerase-like protein